MRSPLLRLLALALVWLYAACASGPPPQPDDADGRGGREVVLSSEYEDRRVGEESAIAVASEMGILQDPALIRYVNQIGQRLVRYAPRRDFDYKFQIVEQDAPNAFALPGGYIFISRGLLVLTNSEEELANVLCHEVIHVAARHAAARQAMIRGMPGALQFMAQGSIASYSRDQEREADRLGQGLCALAGYDPEGMATFLKDLEFTERLRFGASRLPYFMDTHPTTTERVAAAGSRARITRWKRQPPIAGGRAAYLRKIDGLSIGSRGEEGVFQGDRFLHPELGFSLRFPQGWLTRNTRRAVGAISPERNAQVFFEFHGPGDDPRQAAEEFMADPENRRLKLKSQHRVQIGEYPAWRIEAYSSSQGGPVHAMVTFVAREGTIFRLTGAASSRGWGRYQGAFLSVARSFRPLTPAQRRSIYETRLRIAAARAGEDLQQLGRRSGNTWNVQLTAVMNDLYANARLEEGQLVKIAVAQSYGATRAR